MAFLDNSGDIILDAVLTDTGRWRLARGNFKIGKFALGDDEINYHLYRNSNNVDGAHPSGSAYYDLQIMQTPVLESFTNNTSNMHSKLVSYATDNLLYLPVIALNTYDPANKPEATYMNSEGFIVAVDTDTQDALGPSGEDVGPTGIIDGATITNVPVFIRLDQGLNTTAQPPTVALDADLREDQYVVEIDNRLGGIVSTGGLKASPSFIDDDNIASYFFSLGVGGQYVSTNEPKATDSGDTNTFGVAGPRGTTFKFSLAASTNVQTSTYLFDLIGKSTNLTIGSTTFRVIDTTIRVTGQMTGYRIDIPVKLLKKT